MTRDNDPAYWRKRAEDARKIAAMMEDPGDRQLLQNIAAGYDRLAGFADLLAASIRPVPLHEAPAGDATRERHAGRERAKLGIKLEWC